MTASLELYHWEPNCSSLKTLLCLHEKGLSFESRYVDLLQFAQYREDFLSLNPEGQVPVLIHDGRVLTESQFINEYLDEVFDANPLRPDSAADRWRMRVWGKFAGEVLEPAASTLGCHAQLAPLLRGRDIAQALKLMPLVERRRAWKLAAEDGYGQELIEDSRRMIKLAVDKLEESLEGSDWLVGGAFSLADIEMFATFHALEDLVPDLVNARAAPRAVRWLERVRQRPAVNEALGHSRTGNPQQAYAPGPEHSRWG